MICVCVHLSQTAVKLDGFVSVALMQMEKNEGIYKDNPERNVFFSPVLSHTREKLIERKSPDNKSVCFLSTEHLRSLPAVQDAVSLDSRHSAEEDDHFDTESSRTATKWTWWWDCFLSCCLKVADEALPCDWLLLSDCNQNDWWMKSSHCSSLCVNEVKDGYKVPVAPWVSCGGPSLSDSLLASDQSKLDWRWRLNSCLASDWLWEAGDVGCCQRDAALSLPA